MPDTLDMSETLTYKQWKKFMEQYEAEIAALPPSKTLEGTWNKAVKAGFIKNERPEGLITREETLALIKRANKSAF